MNLDRKGYSIVISDNVELSQLKSTWIGLELQNHESSFFHSWNWVDTWLRVYKPEVLLVSAEIEGTTVAIGLFGKSQETRHYLVKSHQLRLFQTGDPQEDQIWVEFNDFLCHPEHTTSGLSIPVYRTNLQPLSADSRQYIDSLSRNTRYQISRSKKKYENLYGPLKLSFAKDVAQALQYWQEAGELHASRWRDSGFKNPKFVRFHEDFMKRSFDSGMIDMVKLTAGDHLVGIIYNIIYKDNVYFYLQGLQYETDGKLKSGLTAHSLLTEHYLKQGLNSYNFMGGYSQYKEQLSQPAEHLLILKIQKPLVRFWLENLIRSIKQKIL